MAAQGQDGQDGEGRDLQGDGPRYDDHDGPRRRAETYDPASASAAARRREDAYDTEATLLMRPLRTLRPFGPVPIIKIEHVDEPVKSVKVCRRASPRFAEVPRWRRFGPRSGPTLLCSGDRVTGGNVGRPWSASLPATQRARASVPGVI